MFKKIFLLCCFLSFTMMGLVNAQELDLQSVNERNTKVNEDIGKGLYHTHSVTLNVLDQPFPPYKNYKETIYFYFAYKDQSSTLAKVIVTKSVAGRTSYTDYLFDREGNLTVYDSNADVARADADKVKCYFLKKKMKKIFRNGEEIPEDMFITEDLQEGVDALNASSGYYRLFDSMIKTQKFD